MKMNQQLHYNQLAPDLKLVDLNGKEIQLSSLWHDRPLVLAFSRHFGCTQCKQMLAQLVENRERIESSGLSITVITQGTVETLPEYSKTFAPGLYTLADPQRLAYQAYGLERGGIFQTFLNFKVWAALSQAKKKGLASELPPAGQDAMQMSGVFIISPEGRVLLPFYYDNIADHPSIDLLLSGVLSTRWDAPFDGPIGTEIK
jgi:peroxiredoxin